MITGAQGRLGSELKKLYPKAHCPVFEIREWTDLSRIFKECEPDIVIHCAAMTNVGECEKHPWACYDINVLGTAGIVEFCEVYDSKLVYISTDHVFDGEKGMYKETDIPNPTSMYAKSKLMGEWFTLTNPKNLVIRTSFMKDFPFKKAYTDKMFNAEKVGTIAKMVKKAVDMNLTGLYHIAGKPKTVFDLARKFNPKVEPMCLVERPTNDIGMKYLKDTTMDISKWENAKRTYRRKHKL
jgi:dTDP-4-dehydrorhamnose reductase